MDPQKLSSLDPKLRDAYQRVMGTVIPEPQVAPIQTQAPSPINKYTVSASSNPIPNSQAQSSPQPAVEPQPAINPQPAIPPTQPASNFVQMNSQVPATSPAAAPNPNFAVPAPQVQTMVLKKKKSGTMTIILFGIVGLILIAAYTFLWIKIFNLKLPFLP